MSPRTARSLVFLALLFTLPLPMLVFDGLVPVVRFLLLATVCIGMRVAEGPGGVVGQLTALFLGQALVYALLLWLVAWAAGRALAALSPRARAALVASAVLALCLWSLVAEPYATPFGRAARGGLLEVLR